MTEIKFRIAEDLKEDFNIIAIKKKTDMSELLREFVKYTVKKDKKLLTN